MAPCGSYRGARPVKTAAVRRARLSGVARRLTLEHDTVYRFDPPVRIGPHVVRLRPAPHAAASVVSHELAVDGVPAAPIEWSLDREHCFASTLTAPGPVGRLGLRSTTVIDLSDATDTGAGGPRRPALAPRAARRHRTPVAAGAQVDRLVRSVVAEAPAPGSPLALAAAAAVARSVRHEQRHQQGVLDPEATLLRGEASCRDSAWLLVATLRALGLAARFTTGLLVLPGAAPADDRLELHAWAEAFVDGSGWSGVDATTGRPTGAGHVPLSAAPSPAGAAPVSGRTEPCAVELSVTHRLRRDDEAPPA